MGPYTYGDPAHLHATTAIGSAWSGKYDAAGNLTCRAPSSATTCPQSGTLTGAKLTFDVEGRLAAWQDTQSSPNTTVGFLYDNEGARVAQQVVGGATTTTTVYVGGLEEVTTSGSTTTTSVYYYAGGKRIAEAVNGVFSYLASDGLGSANVVLNASGSATASQLFTPYGGTRYSNGTMPTDYGFTGQHADSGVNGMANTGLDYYNARYYDPLAGQFTSPDSILPGGGFNILGLSRYAYVAGNPETLTDPSGQCWAIVCAAQAAVGFVVGVGQVAWGLAQGGLAVMSNPIGTVRGLGLAALDISLAIKDNPRRAAAEAFAGAAAAVGSLHERLTTGSAFDRGQAAGQIVATVFALGLPIAKAAQFARVGFAARGADAAAPSLFEPGPYAGGSVPSAGPGSVSAGEQRAVNALGDAYGCHTCGTMEPGTPSGNWVGDHQPVSRFVQPGQPQNLYPQCLACSRQQGLAVINALRRGWNPYANLSGEEP